MCHVNRPPEFVCTIPDRSRPSDGAQRRRAPVRVYNLRRNAATARAAPSQAGPLAACISSSPVGRREGASVQGITRLRKTIVHLRYQRRGAGEQRCPSAAVRQGICLDNGEACRATRTSPGNATLEAHFKPGSSPANGNAKAAPKLSRTHGRMWTRGSRSLREYVGSAY